MILEAIASNPFAAGLMGTAALGGVMYQLRRIPTLIKSVAHRQSVVTMTVSSADDAFEWVDKWLSDQPYTSRARSVALKTYSDGVPRDTGDAHEWTLAPGYGWHWFMWRGNLVWFSRERDDKSPQGAREPLERITLKTIGRSQRVLRELVAEAKSKSTQRVTVPLFVWQDGYWGSIAGKAPRNLSSVVLASGLSESIVADVAWFIDARGWYTDRGIPWRRGYLLSGPPGTGKTSFVLALAGHFGRPVCILSLGSLANDNALLAAVTSAKPNAIVLIEDIDCASQSHARTEDDKEDKGITKAGLLNALDGIATPDGRLFVMTTNFPDRLDDALLRPGRADRHFVFDYIEGEAQERMAARYYGAGLFAAFPSPTSPAVLQAAFMRNPDYPDKARSELMT